MSVEDAAKNQSTLCTDVGLFILKKKKKNLKVKEVKCTKVSIYSILMM